MYHQASLDLVAYLDSALGHHCPLCFFLDIDTKNTECPHKPTAQTSKDVAAAEVAEATETHALPSSEKPLPQVPRYAASTTSSAGFSFAKSVDTVIARVSVSDSWSSGSEGTRQRGLKRKSLPTGTNLRELNARHSDEELLKVKPSQELGLKSQRSHQRLLRVQQSDERLRLLYEEQTMSYLESPIAEFGPFG